MKYISTAIGAAAIVSICAMAAAKAPAKTARAQAAPPYSFLPQGGSTVKSVMLQLEADPRLRGRYANHYRQPQDQVMRFFRTQLVESVIPATRAYTVWYAHMDGRKYAKVKTIRKGTRVLATREGKPFLHSACGNALTFALSWPPKPKPKASKPRVAKVKPMSESRRRYANMVTPFETGSEYLAEAPYELALRTPFADVPHSLLRNKRMLAPFWIPSRHGNGVPEPSSLAFLGVGVLPMLLLLRPRKNTRTGVPPDPG